MSNQTPTDPWNDIYEGIAFNYEDDKLITAIELARATEREQHQREIAQRDETIRQFRERVATLTAALEEAIDTISGWQKGSIGSLDNVYVGQFHVAQLDRLRAALAAAPQGREIPDPQKGELTDVEM